MTALRHILRRIGALGFDRRGGTAVTVALALPVLAALACGAIDLFAVNADRARVQAVADAAALMAAKQLGAGDVQSLKLRAEAYVQDQLGPIATRLRYTLAVATPLDHSSVTVTVSGRRTSFFANLLPPGGWPVNISATAAPMGRMPLCVLSSGQDKADQLQLKDSGEIVAPNCLVHSNGDIEVKNTGWLQAGVAQAAGLATGRISPSPRSGAPNVDDPFADINLTPPTTLADILDPITGLVLKKVPPALCAPPDILFQAGYEVLEPGVHCGKIKVAKNATLKLKSGDHYFIKGSKLELEDNAVLDGTDGVVLVFDKDSDFNFKGAAQIKLVGRKSGDLAGFVIATTRLNDHTFEVSSSNARQLLGTVYVPSATLSVTGAGNRVADQSAWTVIVAKSIKLSGSADLVINTDYAGSSVPVPDGVGPSSANVALRH